MTACPSPPPLSTKGRGDYTPSPALPLGGRGAGVRVGIDLRPMRLMIREQYRRRRYRQVVMTTYSRQLHAKTRREIGNIYSKRVTFTRLRWRIYRLSLPCFSGAQLCPLFFWQHIRARNKAVSWHTYCWRSCKSSRVKSSIVEEMKIERPHFNNLNTIKERNHELRHHERRF